MTRSATRRTAPSTGTPGRAERLAQDRLVPVAADPVEHHAAEPDGGVEGGEPVHQRGDAAGLRGGVHHQQTGARSSRGDVRGRGEPGSTAGWLAPSNRPITPSTTATSAPRAPCRNSGAIRSSPTSHGSRLRPGRPAASAVVAGVDVVGADLVRGDREPARRAAPPSARSRSTSSPTRTTARATTRRGDGRAHHSIPRWPFWPASIGCLTLVISTTRSAASTSAGCASRPVMTTCWLPGPVDQGVDHLVDVHPAPLHRVGELVEDVEAGAPRRRGRA